MKLDTFHVQCMINTRSRAFTLIELMISIALVLLLILGVNQVFTYTTQAVGAGESIISAIRLSRAAQSQFAADFSAIVPNGGRPNDSAFMMITSRAAYAFSNAKDQAAEGTISSNAPATGGTGLPADNSAFLDLDGNGLFGDKTVNGEVVYPATYNLRHHRLDTLSFFGRGQFSRQTGDDGTFVNSLTSQEAWIWYGHVQLPDNAGNYLNGPYPNSTFPCAGTSATNPNNYFGSKLVLGRVAMLLRELARPPNNPVSGTADIYDNQSFAQHYIDYSSPTPAWSSILFGSKDTYLGSTVGDCQIQNSRYDVARGSISQFRLNLQSLLNATPTATWWTQVNASYQANPFISKPMSSADMAKASPYFIGGCSQFMVEFAGDFLTQDNDQTHLTRVPGTNTKYGDIIGSTTDTNGHVIPDGQLDFCINSSGAKQIIWYGMPRGTSGQTTICAVDPAVQTNNSAYPYNPHGDVVPLRDWLQYVYDSKGNLISSPGTDTPAGFEKLYPSYTELKDYGGNSATPMTVADAQNGYTCAFGPNDPHPKLIRITITLDDPTGRLPDGQTYQFVYALPQ